MEINEDTLAQSWWRYHGRHGLLGSRNPITDAQAEELQAVDDWVAAKSNSVPSLAHLVELLARHVPSEKDLPYIGTWVLEDADMDGGASPTEALSLAQLSSPTIDAIRSGYLPPLAPQ